jgi:alkylation response protein AidB-like acyl-CoA dehydrogenase
MGTVVVDMDADGVRFTSDFTNMAEEIQSQIHLNDVVVPEEHVLTRGGDAFQEQLKALNWERLGSAALYNATALCALDAALAYADDRVQFDQPIGDFQGIEWKLADMVTRLQASRHLTFQAGRIAVEDGRVPNPMATTMAKLFASEVSNFVVDEALQIHGANGYQQGHDLEYLYRLARGFPIAGGTDEIQKNSIATFLEREGVPRLS